MSIAVEFELRCDGVDADGTHCITPPIFAYTRADARKQARHFGWRTQLPGGKDHCPQHRTKR